MKPEIIYFPPLGVENLGYLSVVESLKNNVVFDIKRVFWVYNFNEDNIERGFHAHHKTKQILVSLSGEIEVFIEMPDGEKFYYLLDSPNSGLYIPPMAWHYMKYRKGTIQLVIASEFYSENDYIRDYDDFEKIWKK